MWSYGVDDGGGFDGACSQMSDQMSDPASLSFAVLQAEEVRLQISEDYLIVLRNAKRIRTVDCGAGGDCFWLSLAKGMQTLRPGFTAAEGRVIVANALVCNHICFF